VPFQADDFGRKLAHVAPELATQGLLTKLTQLESMLRALQQGAESGTHPVETAIVESVEQILASGASLYEASVTSGSLQGGPGRVPRNPRVSEWVEASGRTPNHTSGASTGSTSASALAIETPATTINGHDPTCEWPDEVGHSDDSGDDELTNDMIHIALGEGGRAFDKQQWKEAESMLEESLADLKRLSRRQQTAYDLFELRYKLAACAYHTKEPETVKDILLGFTALSPSSDDERRRLYDAGHLLAQQHVRLGALDLARSSCENVLKARKRLLGKSAEPCYESLALMARIHRLMGDQHRARIYSLLIPDSQRQVFTAAADALKSTELQKSNSKDRTATPANSLAKGDNLQHRKTPDMVEFPGTSLPPLTLAKLSVYLSIWHHSPAFQDRHSAPLRANVLVMLQLNSNAPLRRVRECWMIYESVAESRALRMARRMLLRQEFLVFAHLVSSLKAYGALELPAAIPEPTWTALWSVPEASNGCILPDEVKFPCPFSKKIYSDF